MKKQNSDNLKRPCRTGSRAGSALITVLGVSLILMLAGTTMVTLSRQSIFRIRRTANYAQAQAVAEAGVADMLAKLGTNYTRWQNVSVYTMPFFSNGTYYVKTQLTNSHVLITSDGLYKGESNRTVMEVLCTDQDSNNLRFGANCAILSDGLVTLASGAYDIYGDVHGNKNVGLANGDVFGAVTAVGVVNPTSGGNSHQAVRLLPEFNFESYLWMAKNGGSYVEGITNGWTTLSGANLGKTAANGILYVNGNLSIANRSSFTGTIVVNGNIQTANKFDQYPYPGRTNGPSLLSTGAIDLNNHETYNGVVFAKTSININNKVTIIGGIISGGITYIKNGVTVTNSSSGYPAWDPLNPAVSTKVISGGWLK